MLPALVLENQFGEISINQVLSSSGATYTGEGHSFQVLPIDLNIGSDAGSDDDTNPKFLSPVMGNLIGENMAGEGNYLGGLIGALSLTGTQASEYPVGGVLGIIMDTVIHADGAVVAVIDGDSGVTKANAAFKARMLNSTAGSGFDYGLDLYDPAFGAYLPLAILKADLRLANQVCMLTGAGVPVDGTTGQNFAAKGSMYIDRTNGKMYLNGGTISATVWKIVTSA